MSYFCYRLMQRLGSPPRLYVRGQSFCGGDGVSERTSSNATYNVKMTTLVRCILGSLKGALEVERRIIHQLDLDVGRLVVLAICDPQVTTVLATRTPVPAPSGHTGNLFVNAA